MVTEYILNGNAPQNTFFVLCEQQECSESAPVYTSRAFLLSALRGTLPKP
jgi:hypothetical protein